VTRLWFNRIVTWLLVAAFVIAVLYFAGTHIKAASGQRFVRVGWDVIEVTTERQSVIDTIKDTKTGTCKAFYRIEYPRQNVYPGSPAIALSDFGYVNCDGQAVIPPMLLPMPASAIK